MTDPRYRLPASGAYWRVAEGGDVALRSRSLWDQELEPTRSVHLSPTGKAIEQRGPNGSTVYVMEREVRLDDEGAPRVFHLAVALDTAPIDALRRSFVKDVAFALGLIGLVLFGGAWLQASVGLWPLRRLRDELAQSPSRRRAASRRSFSRRSRAADQGSQSDDRTPGALVRKARERAGDLAHGLKTPLTILQGEARRLESGGNGEFGGIAESAGRSDAPSRRP